MVEPLRGACNLMRYINNYAAQVTCVSLLLVDRYMGKKDRKINSSCVLIADEHVCIELSHSFFYSTSTIRYTYMAQLHFIERFRTFCMAIERVRRAFLRQPFHIPLHECSRMKTPPALSPRRRTNNSTYYTYKQRVTQDRTRSFFQKCSFYENVFKILPFT